MKSLNNNEECQTVHFNVDPVFLNDPEFIHVVGWTCQNKTVKLWDALQSQHWPLAVILIYYNCKC